MAEGGFEPQPIWLCSLGSVPDTFDVSATVVSIPPREHLAVSVDSFGFYTVGGWGGRVLLASVG